MARTIRFCLTVQQPAIEFFGSWVALAAALGSSGFLLHLLLPCGLTANSAAGLLDHSLALG